MHSDSHRKSFNNTNLRYFKKYGDIHHMRTFEYVLLFLHLFDSNYNNLQWYMYSDSHRKSLSNVNVYFKSINV